VIATGYTSGAYAESLSEFGSPRLLPRSGGWILEREIEGFAFRDATGCYPLFCCQDWASLHVDLEEIGAGLVSLAVVCDPFGEYDEEYLAKCFADVVLPFKQHFVVDLSREPAEFVAAHHRRNARRAAREVTVEECERPVELLDDWHALYAELIARHGIEGLTTFSKRSFAQQLEVPGIVALRAVRDGATVGMLLWYIQRDVAYYHLGAYSRAGYELKASFALFDYALGYFARRGLRWANLGGAPGASTGEEASGLGRFKQGWSTGTRTAYFCGRIFDAEKYDEIVRSKGIQTTTYFPAYRSGEFR
jgi:hypothetical protein